MNDLRKSDTWKIQLTTAINLISFKDNDEERKMHSKSNDINITINAKADEILEELFESLLSRYQIGLETPVRGRDISSFIIL